MAPVSLSPPSTPMERALSEAYAAMDRGEVPVGAVVTASDGTLLSAEGNRVVELCDPSAHAEMLAIREACRRLGLVRLVNCDLHVSLEPCAMCAGVISFARIRCLYYGAEDAKGGAVDHGTRFFHQPGCHHAPQVYGGIAAREAGDLLKGFFRRLRTRQSAQEAVGPSGRQA